jgi:hypothetical protein
MNKTKTPTTLPNPFAFAALAPELDIFTMIADDHKIIWDDPEVGQKSAIATIFVLIALKQD